MVWRLACVLALVIGWAWPAAAHETDQFTIPAGREFADLGEYLNRWAYGVIDRAVDKTNADIRHCIESGASEREVAEAQSDDAIVHAVNSEMPWAMDVIEGFEKLVESPQIQRRYPGRVVGYKKMFGNILQHTHFVLDPRQFFRLFLGSTLKVYGTYMGTDKIGHFTDMGMNYYRVYSAARRDGKSEAEADADAVYSGTHGLIFSERGMLGYLTAGAYSNGDLAANYVGYLFYRNLTEPISLKGKIRAPMLVRDGPYWRIAAHVRRDSDFFEAFISDHFDEALNPSLFEPGMRSAVRKAVVERAPNVLWRYRDERGNIRPKEYFDQKVQELSTYWGRDYGHQGSLDKLIAIGNTCFASSGAAGGAPPTSQPVYLVEQNAGKPDARGRTALHWAARGMSAAGLAELLGKKLDVNARDNQKQTPLHYAAASGNLEAATALLEHGADLAARDSFGTTPLHLAAAGGRSEIVELLLKKGADVSVKDDFGYTPLHEAARAGSEQMIRLLLDAGAKMNATDDYGTTPLHLACRNSRILNVGLLVQRGADVNAKNAAGSTPLHEAALAGDRNIVRMLIARGADPSAANGQNRTPEDIASARGYDRVADVLRRSHRSEAR